MKGFFKYVFAATIGIFIAWTLVALSFVAFGLIGSLFGGGDKAKVEKNSVLKIKFDELLPEQTGNVAVSPFDFSAKTPVGLQDMIEGIRYAKTDDKIKGIYIESGSPAGGLATASKVREALIDFKTSGKFVVAYNTMYTQKGYFIASTADEIYLNPIGGVEFTGFGAEIPFLKDMLDRVGINAQVYHVGKFKSATEPVRYKQMSDENRLQVREYLSENWEGFKQDLSVLRNIPVDSLQSIADNYSSRLAEDALELGLVDALKYRDEVHTVLRTKLDIEEDDDINAISVGTYSKSYQKEIDTKAKKNKIAIVYAEGSIVDGNGEEGSIGGDRYAKIFREINKDEDIKAVVLRVNSGGGSALASDIMWRELMRLKEEGKPVMCSMGDVAASGGYYIAAPADTIFAESNTITGSIGVFGLIPSMQKFMAEEVGITFDTVKTAEYAAGISLFRDISPEEGEIIQEGVEHIYDVFLDRVATGRGMTVEAVHEVAQGRVWTGNKALSLGLVDKIGDTEDAVRAAAAKARMDEFQIVEYPKQETFEEKLVRMLQGGSPATAQISDAIIKEQTGSMYKYIKMVKEIENMKGVQARMPFTIEVQ